MIYFDNSATTKPYKEVLDSFMKVSENFFGNPSSLHSLGAASEKLLSKSRQQIADLLQVKESEVLFTSGGTEGNNLAVKGTALIHAKRGKHMITTAVEHPSVLEAFRQLSEEFDFDVTYLEVDSQGRISAKDLLRSLRSDTILVSVMHVNNEVGTLQPIQEIGNILSKYPKVIFHVDYVQGAGKVPLDIKKCKIDLLTISAHKFHGLKGSGVLYIRDGVHISPLFSGGSQEWKFRSGTENVAGIVAMAKALRMTMEMRDREISKMIKVRNQLKEGLNKIEGTVINSPEKDSAPHILNFSIPGLKSEVFVHALEEKNIFVSTTSACSSKRKTISSTVLAMFKDEARAESTVRISLSYHNTAAEAESVIAAAKEAIIKLREVMR
ncbi:cysteine desulfurase family protein [Peribacillus deserti]|uniref:cysteine desulfurase family protein n=1 Tax=Peribacillus deserti TaxID=673318 RepID=UPI00195E1CA3|nr:cysteine desulfurase family protein [Peribacillus deserti]